MQENTKDKGSYCDLHTSAGFLPWCLQQRCRNPQWSRPSGVGIYWKHHTVKGDFFSLGFLFSFAFLLARSRRLPRTQFNSFNICCLLAFRFRLNLHQVSISRQTWTDCCFKTKEKTKKEQNTVVQEEQQPIGQVFSGLPEETDRHSQGRAREMEGTKTRTEEWWRR